MLYATVIALSIMVFVGVWLVVRYPGARKAIPGLKVLLQASVTTLDYWEYKREYVRALDVSARYLSLLEVVDLRSNDKKEARKKLTAFTIDLYYSLGATSKEVSEAVKVSAATHALLASHEELVEVVVSAAKHESLEVRKATYLLIDVLGELFDLESELTQEYFQHLIYGLNQCLVQIRNEGTGTASLKKVTSTLFRVYKITRAYKYLNSRNEMTKEEFYEAISGMFNRLFS